MADRLLASLLIKTLGREKERFRERECNVLVEERGLLRHPSRLLSGLGYRLVSNDGRRTAGSGVPRGRAAARSCSARSATGALPISYRWRGT